MQIPVTPLPDGNAMPMVMIRSGQNLRMEMNGPMGQMAIVNNAESGERLCPDHAADFLKAGKTVTPPERYAEGIVHSEASAAFCACGWKLSGNCRNTRRILFG